MAVTYFTFIGCLIQTGLNGRARVMIAVYHTMQIVYTDIEGLSHFAFA